jgi:RHS repeat-associated protein
MTSTTDVRLLVVDHLSRAGYAEVIEERTESGLIVASYLYGAGLDPISVFRLGQPVGLYVPDGHSGVRQVVDLAGVAAVLAAYRYDAFGNKVAQATAGTFTDVVGYRGERFDVTFGQYHMRERPYHPPTGRFNGLDSFVGRMRNPQSLHKYVYGHNDPVNNIDPTGRFSLASGLVSIGIRLGALALPGPGDFILAGLQALVEAYAVNLEWDLEWAFDWDLPDNWHSRSDNTWVLFALLSGVYNAFEIGIPLTDIGFNPLDPFLAETRAASAPARRGSPAVRAAGGRTFKFSRRAELTTAQGETYKVNLYYNKNVSSRAIAVFPPRAVKKTARITPNGPGDAGKAADIRDANKLHGKPTDYDWSDEYGEPMTWHHTHKRGYLVLVSRRAHRQLGSHIGQVLW